MALSSGTRLGPYVITAQIGAGGMARSCQPGRTISPQLASGDRGAAVVANHHRAELASRIEALT
jgi:hypothetical protein